MIFQDRLFGLFNSGYFQFHGFMCGECITKSAFKLHPDSKEVHVVGQTESKREGERVEMKVRECRRREAEVLSFNLIHL